MQNSKSKRDPKKILVIPAAGRSSRYPGSRPKWLLTHPHGRLMIEEVVAGLNMDDYDEAHIVILKEHCEKHSADTKLLQIFGDIFNITILNEPTDSAPETVVKCIETNNLEGIIIVKDCDGLVSFNMPTTNEFVVGLDIHTQNIKNITAKSFIQYDENNIIKNIVEKRVVSDLICLGVYAIPSHLLLKAYNSLSSIATSELYFSHLISFLISSGETFSLVLADAFFDWGTSEEWHEYTSNLRTYVFDIDGIFLENRGRYGKETWDNTFIPIEENIKVLEKLSDSGAEIIFITSRTEEYLDKFKNYLASKNIKYKVIISNCNHNKRIIVNDFSATNPYPSCEALNIPRNANLGDYLPRLPRADYN
jgi:hypothetical protein